MKHLLSVVAAVALVVTLSGCSTPPTAKVTIGGYGVSRNDPRGPLAVFQLTNRSGEDMPGFTLTARCVERGALDPTYFGPLELDLRAGAEHLVTLLDWLGGRATLTDKLVVCEFQATVGEQLVDLEVEAEHATPGFRRHVVPPL